ncbi:cuticlin-1 [Ditylenchus destructor]|nr:cuticlin-1 [Ditylenchus destructor]
MIRRDPNPKPSHRLPLISVFSVAFLIASLAESRTVIKTTEDEHGNGVEAQGYIYANEIADHPEIECAYGVVHFRVHTTKSDPSSVYVRGQSSNQDCVFHNTRNVTIELAKCNIRRKREVNPSGVNYQMTVIVQLHPLFVTKVDRAYNVNCFYQEKRQDVNVEFGVSDITTQMITHDAKLPACTYEVHRDSPNGPLVKYTRVGEQLYHVWACPSTMYQMLLYNCAAIDSKGKDYPILDENGCSKDEFLLPQITYSENNRRAYAPSSAFNFPDKNTMSFACKIRLCYNSDCGNITPPRCGKSKVIATGNPNENSVTDEPLSEVIDGDGRVVTGSSTPVSSTITTRSQPSSSRSTVSIAEKEEEETSRSTSAETTQSSPRTRPSSTSTETQPSSSPTASTEEFTSTSQRRTTLERTTPSSWEAIETDSTPFPDDFPTPSAFVFPRAQSQADEPLDHKRNNLMLDEEFMEKAMKLDTKAPTSTVMSSEETMTSQEEGIQISTQPVKVFNKAGVASPPSAEAAKAANSKNMADATSTPNEHASVSTRQPNRTARDTTLPGASGGGSAIARAHNKRVVDFDITSPELTIMDDYLEPGTAQRLSADPTSATQARDTLLWSVQRSGQHSTGVCFSSTALICAGSLMTLLTIAVIFVLIKSRKTVHSFY